MIVVKSNQLLFSIFTRIWGPRRQTAERRT